MSPFRVGKVDEWPSGSSFCKQSGLPHFQGDRCSPASLIILLLVAGLLQRINPIDCSCKVTEDNSSLTKMQTLGNGIFWLMESRTKRHANREESKKHIIDKVGEGTMACCESLAALIRI